MAKKAKINIKSFIYLVNKLLINVILAMLDLSGTNNKLIDAINIVKRVRTFKLGEFLFFTKTPYISNSIPLINKINSGNIELKFEKNIIC